MHHPLQPLSWLMKDLCMATLMLGLPAAGRAEFDQFRLIDQLLNRLGNAMAINRAIIAESGVSSAVGAASEALAQ